MNQCPNCGGPAYAIALRKKKQVKMECGDCKSTWLEDSKICPACEKPNGFTVPGLCSSCYSDKLASKWYA